MAQKGRRGAGLIVALGILALLSLIAAAFATRVGLDRATSRNYLDAVRARLLAQSGVDDAVARLRDVAAREGFLDNARWVHAGPSRPSFALTHPDGRTLPATGVMSSGTYAPAGDTYAVRVTDAQSQINVNEGAARGPSHSLSLNLRRLLNILGAQPGVDVPGLGDKILQSRPPGGGFPHKCDALRALDPDQAARVRDFLTAASWSDPHVAEPVPLSGATASEYPVPFARPSTPSGPVYRYGHQRNFRGKLLDRPLLFFDPSNPDPSHNAVWGRDSLSPQWVETVSRSPVNVNTAARPVLMALLVDLEGFFLVERRRDDPAEGSYAWAERRYTYDATGTDGGECGFIHRTLPLVGPGGRHTQGIPASSVADAIVACRERRGEYAAAPFGGPFRTWRQFNLFADHLVSTGVLKETRPHFSGPQIPVASQAIADVLKANFNPNLHLNEINPDRNLFTHVDKTDLVTHSAEFCFTPMGVFEIESTGKILGPSGQEVARQDVLAHVRLFDAVRETTQAQFYAGEIAPRKGPSETNNNRSLETGPEPDNGPAPAENGYEGYVRLSTYGGNFFGPDLRKPPAELWTTLSSPAFYPGAVTTPAPGRGHLGSSIHAHFQLDHAAHHHANRSFLAWPRNWDGFRLPQGAWTTVAGRRCGLNSNWEDRTESARPPYSPVASPRFRLARSFSGVPPEGLEAAPSDLRLDGAYVERDSAFGYWIEENVSFNFNEGAVAFWVKPAFFPEMTGKARTLFSASRYHAYAPTTFNPSPFTLFFLPGGGDESARPAYLSRPRPNSLAFGFGFSHETGYNWEMQGLDGPGGGPPSKHATGHAFAFTPTLNHEGHEDGRWSELRAHQWTHVTVTWKNPRLALPRADSPQIYVNGRVVPGTVTLPHLYVDRESLGQPFEKTPRWTLHSLRAVLDGTPRWCANSIRIGGEPSRLFGDVENLPYDGFFPRNFSADATFDEFYVWLSRSSGLSAAGDLWSLGRYYRPDDSDPADAVFTSRPIELPRPTPRALPPAGEAPEVRPRLLAVAWTEIPGVHDHSEMPARELDSSVEFHVGANGAWFGPYRDAAYSPVRASGVDSPVHYRAKFKVGAGPDAILLSSPALDDVTLYFESGDPVFLGYMFGGMRL